VAVSAGVVGIFQMSAFIAYVKMVTKPPGAAAFDVGHDRELFPG
jgi:hypothetical protein